MDFSSTITVPHSDPDQSRALWEQLLQDGFATEELKVPPISSLNFEVLVQDARSFSNEVSIHSCQAWPLRCERWLNRLSSIITGQMFVELPIEKRRAICHAAILLAERPELLA